MSLSTSRLYGSRDFNGRRGEVGPPGSNGNVPPWVFFEQSLVGISLFGGTLPAIRVVGLPDPVTSPSWVLPSQTSVRLSNFGGKIPSSRVVDMPVQFILPEWVNISQEDIQISNFGGSLDYTKIVNALLPASLPTWSSTLLQSSVSSSDFGGQVILNNQVSNRPTFKWDTLLNKPSWVLPSQSNVTLSLFSGHIDASRVNNLPTGDTADWNTLVNKPSWVLPSQSNVI